MFAVVWSTIAGLRATSAMLIWETLGCNLFVLPLIMFGVHLVRCCFFPELFA